MIVFFIVNGIHINNDIMYAKTIIKNKNCLISNTNSDSFSTMSVVDEQSVAILWSKLSLITNSIISNKKYILKDLSGFVNFGELTALMGPSGAGKSTLLKCINGRNKYSSGTIYTTRFREIIPCFIVQDVKEHLMMSLKVNELMIYASKLKNIDLMIDHNKSVKKILTDLMILNTFNTNVSACSGGEQKRIAIGLELTAVQKPNLLCIDEPTSGLDSNAAEIVIQCLKDTAIKHGIALVTSIHQPNQDVLQMFDGLYVLAKGGQCVYFGKPTDLNDCLIQNHIKLSDNQIPIEVLLKISSKGVLNENVIQLIKANESKNGSSIENLINSETERHSTIETQKRSFRFKQFIYLSKRMILSNYVYQWFVYLIQTLVIIGLGLTLAKLYNSEMGKPDGCVTTIKTNNSCINPNYKSQLLLKQNLIYHFFANLMLFFLIVCVTSLTFNSEIKVFLCEHSNGWYSTGCYYFAKTIVDLPLMIIIGFCYIIFGFMISNQIFEWHRTGFYVYCTCTGILCSQGLAFLFGILFSSIPALAVVLSIGSYLVVMFFGGFFIPIPEMAKPFQWVSHISYLKPLFENALILIYGLDRCDTNQISSTLYQMDLHNDQNFNLIKNIIIMTINLIIVRILAFIALILKSNTIKSLIDCGEYKRDMNSVEPILTSSPSLNE